ncbi:MAG: peptide/nickel transport system permease protein [Rhodospirillaceae bacterium]|nr:peptide/nickel transport system permease protein [Rhodospirillaceae bacterium]MEA2853483.1 peptide/nickel transport system permease protein [Rhodospirillaceae bacterium]HEV7543581.1 ABC transporter permease [Reyranella sp.]
MIAGYILRRLAFLPLTLLLVAFATFIVLRLTGNPVDIFLDINRTPEQVEALTKRLHLDQPLPVQFLIFLGDLLHGDFGESLQFTGSAAVVVWERVGATLQLAGTALALAVVLGVLGGLICAVWRDRAADAVISSIAIAGQSMPSFWLGLLLIEFFALQLRWLPTSGYGDLKHLVLPAVTLATILLPNFVLITRTAILELMGEQFVVTGRSKGMSRPRVLVTHILPNAINPVLSFLGIQLGHLMAGSIITETIFAWPGVGRLLINSISHRDVPVVEAAVFFIATAIALANLLVDVLQMLIDPRIRRA